MTQLHPFKIHNSDRKKEANFSSSDTHGDDDLVASYII